MCMRELLPFFLLLLTIVIFILNLFAFMQLIPMLITLPLLFISIYVTLYSFTQKRSYRGMR